MVKKNTTSQGRRKLEMTKISDKSKLQVTFSKRRSGLFKKASELCTLCGVDMAIMVFSPANKPFAFGHPSFDSVVDRFLFVKTGYPPRASENTVVEELIVKLGEMNAQVEEERKKRRTFDDVAMDSLMDGLDGGGLQALKWSMEELKRNVDLTKQPQELLNYTNIGYIDRNKPTRGNFPLINFNFGFVNGNGIF